MEARERIVFHVDMDAFYAGVEVRDDPALRGRPLVIGADPRGGQGRGVVCTASYEARRYGIRSAMPISQAYRLAPHATFLPPDFARYKAASEAVMDVLEGYADVLEVVGMDEAYLDVTDRAAAADPDDPWRGAASLARSLQAAVRRVTGLSCSVGVAPNKSLAKVASDHRKPHGVFAIRPDLVEAFLRDLSVRKLHGCGPKTAGLLANEGLVTAGQVAAAGPDALQRLLGSHGLWLHQVASGRDDRRVEAERGQRKSRGNESTFLRDETDDAAVQGHAARLAGELLADQDERDRRAFSTLTVKVRYAGFVTVTRSHTTGVPYAPHDRLARRRAHAAVQALLAPLLDGRPVRLVGVRLSGFVDPTGQQALPTYGLAWAGLEAPALHVPAARPAAKPRGAFDPGGLRWSKLPLGLASAA